eukprot:COSAG01_NODE_2679_length_7257_cov_144.510056_4_plen_80_part_00
MLGPVLGFGRRGSLSATQRAEVARRAAARAEAERQVGQRLFFLGTPTPFFLGTPSPRRGGRGPGLLSVPRCVLGGGCEL